MAEPAEWDYISGDEDNQGGTPEQRGIFHHCTRPFHCQMSAKKDTELKKEHPAWHRNRQRWMASQPWKKPAISKFPKDTRDQRAAAKYAVLDRKRGDKKEAETGKRGVGTLGPGSRAVRGSIPQLPDAPTSLQPVGAARIQVSNVLQEIDTIRLRARPRLERMVARYPNWVPPTHPDFVDIHKYMEQQEQEIDEAAARLLIWRWYEERLMANEAYLSTQVQSSSQAIAAAEPAITPAAPSQPPGGTVRERSESEEMQPEKSPKQSKKGKGKARK